MSLELRENWLAQVQEDVLEPERDIIDPHHHFFVPGGQFPAYDLSDLWRDTEPHGIRQTVFMQCWEGYRADGPQELMSVGETEWVDGIANEAKSTPTSAQIGAIIGTADLCLGRAVNKVLEAHLAASTRFRGIRLAAAWDADEKIMDMPGVTDAKLYDDANFREGFGVLDEMGLVFDAYNYHHQLPALARLARDFPGAKIVLDHLGTPLGVGSYAGRMGAVYAEWTKNIVELAQCPNVVVKLGGLAMPWNGFGFEANERPPTSDEIVAVQSKYYHFAIQQFGADRCMFESNFPVDKLSLSYTVLWNAFKKMATDYSAADKDAMFHNTARSVYRL